MSAMDVARSGQGGVLQPAIGILFPVDKMQGNAGVSRKDKPLHDEGIVNELIAVGFPSTRSVAVSASRRDGLFRGGRVTHAVGRAVGGHHAVVARLDRAIQ